MLPVRDAAATLGEAIASIRAQTWSSFRCWIADDGSADDSPLIAEAAAREDPRFRVLRFARRGLVPTLNDAFDRVEAPIVARMDADDRMLPVRLERQVRWLDEHPDVDVVACLVTFFGDVSAELRRYESWLNATIAPDEIERDLFVESPLPHPAVTMRIAAVRAAGGYRDPGFPEDYDLWLRLWRAGRRFGKVPELLLEIRDHPGRLTKTDRRYVPRALLECKAEHLVAAKALAGRDVVVWGAGRDGIRAAKAIRRRDARLRHLVDISPRKVGRSMLGVPVLDPESLRREPRCFVVAAVGVPGARGEIRARLSAMGYREGDGFVCFG